MASLSGGVRAVALPPVALDAAEATAVALKVARLTADSDSETDAKAAGGGLGGAGTGGAGGDVGTAGGDGGAAPLTKTEEP